jgi:TonB family protein
MASGVSGAAVEMCQGEDQRKRGDAAAKGTSDRSRLYSAAIDHYRRAATRSSDVSIKARAFDAIATLDDSQHLNDLDQMDRVLREWITLAPDDLGPVFRLATLHEERGFLDAAEDTLQLARHQKPEVLDPYRMLAQFYARRATAVQRQADLQKPKPPTSGPGEPDEQGIYRIGAGIEPPLRLDRAVYPPEAMAAGIEGAVIAEVVISEAGDVKDATVLRSVPMLDEAALKAVRNWHFAPTMVNGQAVPVRMAVTVSFTTR